jgi:predicted TIM-barrel fold metal-dependent hydrolase
MADSSQPQKARHIPIRTNWLSLRSEPVLDPDRPIIDAHHHLWDKPGSRYLWDEMAADIASGHRVVATVFAEGKTNYRDDGDPALRSLGETEMVATIAAESTRMSDGKVQIAAGIIGFVDLTLGEAAGPVLDRHVEAADGRFRGVRSTSAWHADPEARGSIVSPPPGLLYDPEHRRGILELTKRALVFDAWMYHTQLADLTDLAHAMPDTAIVLNHQGGPIGIGPYEGRRQEVFEDWRYFMRKLARYDNIAVKLGGFGMLMAGFDFHDHSLPPTSDDLAQAWGPYMNECIELFGPTRCMFESNFPVDKGTTSYVVLWNAFKKIALGYSDDEKDALFFQTANQVYRLGLRPAATPANVSAGAER